MFNESNFEIKGYIDLVYYDKHDYDHPKNNLWISEYHPHTYDILDNDTQ